MFFRQVGVLGLESRGGTSMVCAPFNRCVECNEVITNPICSACLAERMKMIIAKADAPLAEQITGAEIGGDTTCVLCGQEMGLCAHCFSNDVYEFLQESNSALALEFASMFDFNIRKRLVEFV